MSASSSEVVIIAESTFKSCPPSCFPKTQNGDVQPPSKAMVTSIGDDSQLSNYPKCTKVETFEDIEVVKRQVCERPLILTATCGKHVSRGQR